MTKTHLCPRRAESPQFACTPTHDTWYEDNSCSYCGSFNQDAFMVRLEAGDIEIVPTDKSYKLYLENKGGESFKQTYRNCPSGSTCKGPDDCTHWVTRERTGTEFYFQHLSDEQKTRFIELLNAGKLSIGFPGHFYVLPYFMKRAG